MRIERKKVSELKLAPYNPRVMPPEEMEKLKRSLETFGYVDPIIWNKRTGHVVGGNQRLLALRELGVEEVDVVVVDLPLEKEKALNIALNKISGEWDYQKLAELLDELDDTLRELTGWSMEEIEEIIATNIVMPDEWRRSDDEDDEEVEEAELTPEQEENLNRAWQQWAKEFLEDWEKLKHPMLWTRGAMKIWFLGALYWGKPLITNWHWIYHPHVIDTGGKGKPIHATFEAAGRGHAPAIRGLRFVTSEGARLSSVFTSSAPIGGGRTPANYPVELARDIYDEFAPGGKVLDPTHGWGGRLVGFLLSKAQYYTGIDVSPLTAEGVRKIRDDLLPYVPDKEVELVCEDFEKYEVREGFYDLVFTCPPYFDVEKYIGGNQPHIAYDNYAAWRDGFYTTLFEKSYRALKPGGVLALHVGSQRYPLKDDGIAIARRVGFKLREVRYTGLVNIHAGTSPEKGEVILIWEKPAR